MNVMKNIRIEKVTINIGAGKDSDMLEKGMKLLAKISPVAPIKTITNKRIAAWGLRPGLPIGCKVTLRKNLAVDTLKRIFEAKDNAILESNFDVFGNVSFGIKEYIDIPGLSYDPAIGIIGLEVAVTLERPGYRVKKRRLQRKNVNKSHIIKKEEAIEYISKTFNVRVLKKGEE